MPAVIVHPTFRQQYVGDHEVDDEQARGDPQETVQTPSLFA
jgi:hypothetical protein